MSCMYPYPNDEPCASSDSFVLYRFEFEDANHINSICVLSDSFCHAYAHVCLILGESFVREHLISIHRIF